MADRAGADEGDDLHVGVRMRGEPAVRGDGVVVPDTDRAPAHPGAVVISGKTEVVAGIEPAVLGMAERGKRTNFDHRSFHLGGKHGAGMETKWRSWRRVQVPWMLSTTA